MTYTVEQVLGVMGLGVVWTISIYFTYRSINNPHFWQKWSTDQSKATALGIAVTFPFAGLFYLYDVMMQGTGKLLVMWLLLTLYGVTLVLVLSWVKKQHYFGAYKGLKKGKN